MLLFISTSVSGSAQNLSTNDDEFLLPTIAPVQVLHGGTSNLTFRCTKVYGVTTAVGVFLLVHSNSEPVSISTYFPAEEANGEIYPFSVRYQIFTNSTWVNLPPVLHDGLPADFKLRPGRKYILEAPIFPFLYPVQHLPCRITVGSNLCSEPFIITSVSIKKAVY
jgi:hypothetical protein